MKKKGFARFASFAAPVCAILAFVGFAFKFFNLMFIAGTTTKFGQFSYKDWCEVLKSDVEKLSIWKASRVFMILALIVIVAVAVMALIQLFVENKILARITKIASIVANILNIAFIGCFVGGGLALSNMETVQGYVYAEYYLPHAGPIWIMFFGGFAALFSLISTKKPKVKKEKAE